jgi:tetratricopeptide (TPR) repeat protein
MTAIRSNFLSKVIMAFALVVAASGTLSAQAQDYAETFNSALEAARGKDFSGAVDLFSKAVDQAKAEGDAEVERKSRELIAKIEYTVGSSLLNAERYDEAIAHFDNGISFYPSYSKNYLARASALKKQDKLDEAIPAFVETISVANAESDTKTARSAEEAIRGYYVYQASSALSRNGNRASTSDADEALANLEEMQKYIEPDADAYYYMAEARKIKGQFQQAIELANKALEMHRGSLTDKAKIYYCLGEAQMSLGNNNEAKSAFRNAAYGPYKNSAEHFIETLGTE